RLIMALLHGVARSEHCAAPIGCVFRDPRTTVDFAPSSQSIVLVQTFRPGFSSPQLVHPSCGAASPTTELFDLPGIWTVTGRIDEQDTCARGHHWFAGPAGADARRDSRQSARQKAPDSANPGSCTKRRILHLCRGGALGDSEEQEPVTGSRSPVSVK